MDWKGKVFDDFRLYAVTGIKAESLDVLKIIESVYRGGADIVQLRSKLLPDAALLRLGFQIKKIAKKNRKLFFVNDRVDLALALGADGVHLGQDDMPVSTVRRLMKQARRRLWIGKSTHNLKQALGAEREGADYIGVGPVFATPTKPHAKSTGLGLVRQASRKIRIPWVAIGGIDRGNLCEVIAAGASRIAVVRAIFAAGDPGAAARELKQSLCRFCGETKSEWNP